mmetsp:Transcript_20991/g.43942  ORF Transcript_20991/g.43942 Transcript_20991/m.43942 type:complete len:225 (+) Transcript_20991:497-1171(+)
MPLTKFGPFTTIGFWRKRSDILSLARWITGTMMMPFRNWYGISENWAKPLTNWVISACLLSFTSRNLSGCSPSFSRHSSSSFITKSLMTPTPILITTRSPSPSPSLLPPSSASSGNNSPSLATTSATCPPAPTPATTSPYPTSLPSSPSSTASPSPGGKPPTMSITPCPIRSIAIPTSRICRSLPYTRGCLGGCSTSITGGLWNLIGWREGCLCLTNIFGTIPS